MIRTPSLAALAASAALLLGGCTTTNNYNYPDKARAAAPAHETPGVCASQAFCCISCSPGPPEDHHSKLHPLH